MAVSKQELKQRAIAAIDKNRDKIIALGDSIFSEQIGRASCRERV